MWDRDYRIEVLNMLERMQVTYVHSVQKDPLDHKKLSTLGLYKVLLLDNITRETVIMCNTIIDSHYLYTIVNR